MILNDQKIFFAIQRKEVHWLYMKIDVTFDTNVSNSRNGRDPLISIELVTGC